MDIELLKLLTKANLLRTRDGLQPLGLDQKDGQVRLVERHNRRPFIKEWHSWTTIENLKTILYDSAR